MNTKPKTLEELKEECVAAIRSECSTKISTVLPNTVLDGVAWAVAKLAQHIITDTAYLETKFFPEYATGSLLNAHASRMGLEERRGMTNSSVILQFLCDPLYDALPTYPKGTKVKTAKGLVYETIASVTVSEARRIAFVEARSQKTGPASAVGIGELTTMVDAPPYGHLSVTNVTMSIGGFTEEHDILYRQRILSARDLLSVNTSAFYEALIFLLHDNIIRVRFRTVDSRNSKYVINVLRNDGSYFTDVELNAIKTSILPYLPIHDIDGKNVLVNNFEFVNLYVFVSAQFDINRHEELQNELNRELNEYLDFRFWQEGQKVQWEELIELFRDIEGIIEVNESRVSPPNDIVLAYDQLPKVALCTLQYEIVGEVVDQTIYLKPPIVDITDGKYDGLIIMRGNVAVVSAGGHTAFSDGFDAGFE